MKFLRTIITITASVVLLSLTGCVGSPLNPNPYNVPHDVKSGGQTQAEFESKLAEIDGLTVEKIANPGPNAKGNTGYSIDLNIDEDYRVSDPEALITFLVTSAYSIRDGWMPNETIVISISTGCDETVNLKQAAIDAGWLNKDSPVVEVKCDVMNADGWNVVSIPVSEEKVHGSANLEKLGTWPVTAPEVPTDIILPKGNV